MSVKYIPVQWNRAKWIYDAIMLAGIFAFLWVFIYIVPDYLSEQSRTNAPIRNARAFGACAFVMMSIILCIGPLARLDTRFLAILSNRRHFGVMTAAVALSHAYFVLGWYFSASRSGSRWEAVLFSNTSYDQALGFPFEAFGIFGLICLLLLAATSHDFWLKFLTAPVWKALHFMIYPAYASVVAHVALGGLQSGRSVLFDVIVLAFSGAVVLLHIAAAIHERRAAHRVAATDWIYVCRAGEIAEGRAKIAMLPDGNRVAVFRFENKLSAISNACAHQNGPLGEGRIIDCLVTCPWHGYQYDPRNGRSPAPFTEKIPTYILRLDADKVMVSPIANPPGTAVDPVPVPETLTDMAS